MPFESYTALQSEILNWLGRPDDPLIAPAVPSFIALFEAEARDRLSFRFGEQLDVEIWGTEGIFPLPCDFHSLRRVMYDGRGLRYHPPYVVDDMTEGPGRPLWYTLEGLQLRIAPPPDTELALVIDYIQGIPPLSARVPTNALLQSAPDLYLYGSLACAEGYIGNDERVAGWLQMREAGFERVRRAGIQAMTGGSPLRVRVIGETP